MPELDEAEELGPRKRKSRWLIVIAACVIVIGLVVSLTGVWRVFQPAQPLVPLTELELELPETVPAGGDFGTQQPKWQECGDGFQCADVRAPLDWESPNGETIRLRMVKHEATSGNALGTLFVNPGGPGASGANYVRDSLDRVIGADLQQQYDVIGWDPRGVGASSAVNCFDDAEMDQYLFGIDDETSGLTRGSAKWVEAATEQSAEYGAACEADTGGLLGHVDTMSTVEDLDMLRSIVGDPKLDYLGFSYGTVIGARYAESHPDTVGRMVLDGVLSPTASYSEVVRGQTVGFEKSLREYTEWCLDGRNCPIAPTDDTKQSGEAAIDDAMARIGDLIDRVDADPLTGSDGRAFGASTLLTAIITPLYSQPRWSDLTMLLETAFEGNADVGLQLADSYYNRVDGAYANNLTEAFQAISCLDYPNETGVERMRADAAELADLAPTIGEYRGYGALSCAGWPYPGPADRGEVHANGADPILVVGTTRDPATPYQWSADLAASLESGVLLSLEGDGHTAYGKNECVNEAVEHYLITGTPPKDGLVCS
ncbi:MAG: alpha/beta hydrolase [Leucobacter sp.]